VAAAFGAVDVRVDPARALRPVSGTLCRADPTAALAAGLMHPIVHRDHIVTVVVVGAESTGKSTLVEACAKHFNTAWMPEHGRAFWEAHHDADGKLTVEQLVQLAREHRAGEDEAVQRARGVLFVDTNALTTWMFSHDYYGKAHADLTALAEACPARYDITVLAGDDIA